MGFFDWKQILGRNWAWYSHQKLYDMVKTEATGASAVSDADQTWMDFNTLMAESRQNIDQLLREAGASWEGVAADAMASGVLPLAQWTDDAGTAGDASGGSVQTVGSSFGFIANAMPEPVQVRPRRTPTHGGFRRRTRICSVGRPIRTGRSTRRSRPSSTPWS